MCSHFPARQTDSQK